MLSWRIFYFTSVSKSFLKAYYIFFLWLVLPIKESVSIEMAFEHILDLQGPCAGFLRLASQLAQGGNRFSGEDPIVLDAFIYYEYRCLSLK